MKTYRSRPLLGLSLRSHSFACRRVIQVARVSLLGLLTVGDIKIKRVLSLLALMLFLGNPNSVRSQVVVNEGFENVCSNYLNPFQLGCFPNWIAPSGTPDTSSVLLPPAYQGSRYVHMYARWDDGCVHPDCSEGIALNYAFQSGVTYTISYAAKGFSAANPVTQTYTGNWILTNGLVNQTTATGTCVPSEYTPNIPAGSYPLGNTVFNNSSWTVNTFTFTPTSNFGQIWFRNTQTSSVHGLLGSDILIDNVVIEKICIPAPSISGASSFCLGSSISFVGSVPNCTVTNNVWTVVECDSTGVPVTGAVEWWSPWATGAPGTLTLPSTGGPTVACGKYYRIKLAVQNAYSPWSETTKIIYVNCPPTANAGPD